MTLNSNSGAIPGPPAGTVLSGKYQILHPMIGSSRIGSLFKATDPSGKFFAIRILSTPLQDADNLAKSRQEIKACSSVSQANMVAPLELQEDPQYGAYIVREFVEGRSLSEMLKEKGVFNQNEFLDVFQQAAKGLAHAHRKGMVHGNLKPSNFIITEDYVVRLLDFSVGNSRELANAVCLSSEQAAGQRLDARSDIYSLACVMYESLSGQLPSQGNPVPFISLIPARKVDEQTEALIFRCLSTVPEGRYQSAEVLCADLKRIEEGQEIKPLSVGSAASSRIVLSVITAIVLLVGLGGAAIYFQSSKSSSDKAAASVQYEKQSLSQDMNNADQLFREEKFGHAAEEYNKLEPLVASSFGKNSSEYIRVLHNLGKAELMNKDIPQAGIAYTLLCGRLRENPNLAPKQFQPQMEIYSAGRHMFEQKAYEPASAAFKLAFQIDKDFNHSKNPMRYNILIWHAKAQGLTGECDRAAKNFERVAVELG